MSQFANEATKSLMLVSSSPSVYSTITTINAVVSAASLNTTTPFDGELLSNMDEIISKSLLMIDFGVALVAIFFNIFVLYAVKKANSQSMLEGYRGFLLSLAFSDLLIAITTLFTPIAEFLPNTRVSAFIDRCGRTIVRSFTIAAYMSALLNLAGMSVDHYVGVFYSLRYHQIMTTRLVCITVALSWLLSIIFGFFDLFGTVAHFSVQTTGNAQSPLGGPRFIEAIADGVDSDGGVGDVIGGGSGQNGTGRIDKQFNKLLIDILFGPIGSNENSTQQINWEDLHNFDDSMLMMPQPLLTAAASTMTITGGTTGTTPRRTNKTATSTKKSPSTTQQNPFLKGVSNLEMEDIINVYGNGAELNSTDMIADKFSSSGADPMFDTSLLTLQQDFNIDLDGNRFMDWCSYYTLNKQLMEFAVVFLTVLVFSGLVLIYGRIFREVASKRDEKGLSHRTGKLVVTTVILLGTCFFCWIPFITFEAVMVLLIRTDTIRLLKAETHQQLMIVNKILNTTLILHPLLDPLIYAVRLRVVRTRLKKVYDRIAKCRIRLQSFQTSHSTSYEPRPYLRSKLSVSPCLTAKFPDYNCDYQTTTSGRQFSETSKMPVNDGFGWKKNNLLRKTNGRAALIDMQQGNGYNNAKCALDDNEKMMRKCISSPLYFDDPVTNFATDICENALVRRSVSCRNVPNRSNFVATKTSLKSTPTSPRVDADTGRCNNFLNLSNGKPLQGNSSVFPRNASLSWSSIDEMDVDELYFNSTDNAYFYGDDAVGGEDGSSMSVCSGDVTPTLAPAPTTAVRKHSQTYLLTVQDRLRRHHNRRARRKPSISTSFILGKVASHTRLLFAINGCDLPLEIKNAKLVNQGMLLQESVV